MADLALMLAAVGFIFGMIGYWMRHRHPRLAMFLMSAAFFSLSLWVLASTYELAIDGKAHTFSRHYGTFAKADRPGDFTLSVWVHSILGTGMLIVSIVGMVGAFIKKEIHFKR